MQQESHSTLDAEERQVTDAEERGRGKQYLDECVDSENQVWNATKLDERAELARRSTMDDNKGARMQQESHSSAPGTHCWRRTSQHSVVGRAGKPNNTRHTRFESGRDGAYNER